MGMIFIGSSHIRILTILTSQSHLET